MALAISLFSVLVTTLLGSLTLNASVNSLRTSHQYYSQIRAQQAADGGLALALLNPNALFTNAGCQIQISTIANEIHVSAICGDARAVRNATFQTLVGNDPLLPGHCTDGHGQDVTHNPHCQIGTTTTLLSAVRF